MKRSAVQITQIVCIAPECINSCCSVPEFGLASDMGPSAMIYDSYDAVHVKEVTHPHKFTPFEVVAFCAICNGYTQEDASDLMCLGLTR